METEGAVSAPNSSGTLRRRKAIILVLICTVIGAAAQLLLKLGSSTVVTDSLWATAWSMAFNFPLVLGLSLYGLSTVLFIHALRNEQLSLLYPLISLTYIWVTIVSVALLGESLSFWKVAGVMVIVTGVALLGKDDNR
ncbi:MAG: EamA family transporter [Bryobacterales bacterium]|nr:EamA family transporter [Bryobacterales bacterium]